MLDEVVQWDETPTIEVRVYRGAELVHTELVESEEAAALVVERWSEHDGVRCEVDELTAKERPEDDFEPDPLVHPDDDLIPLPEDDLYG
jgi:hypothetical protein